MKTHQLAELFKKYRKGTLTDEERARLESWYIRHAAKSRHQVDHAEMEERLKFIEGKLPVEKSFARMRRIRPYLSAAAIILLAMFLGIYFYQSRLREPQHDIDPGGNRAILTLKSGKAIHLSSEKAGLIMAGGGLLYDDSTKVPAAISMAGEESPVLLTLTTPKGGQYQVTLSDGTKIWLNAASTLTYPSRFTGKTREVEITGEAYLEVTENKEKPFRVRSKNQRIEVLGTEFNLTAYPDEETVKTTLVNGSVKVSLANSGPDAGGSVLLTPGKQSVLEAGRLHVGTVDIDDAVAWKNGLFRFNEEPLESIMRKISRWYNVEVVFRDASLKTESFEGMVTRYDKVSTVLGMLEKVGNVQFEIQDRLIIIEKKR